MVVLDLSKVFDLFLPLASDCGTAVVITVYLCFQQLPNSSTSLMSTPSQARHKPIPQASPRLARVLDSWSSLLFVLKDRALVWRIASPLPLAMLCR